MGNFWGIQTFFSPYEILVLGNFAFFPSKFCLLYDLWLFGGILTFSRYWIFGYFGLIWEWRLWLKILLFIEVPTIFKYSDFFLEFRPFRENYDLFGNSNTSGIIIFSVKILLQLDFLYILTFSGNSHLSPLVNSDFSGKSNLFENSDCSNFDFFFLTYREFSLF